MDTREAKEYVKKINTEEAIRVFEELIKKKTLFKLMDSEVDFYNKVIEFLREGKNYKEMWRELEEVDDATEWEMVDLKEIKEQYFSKVIR